VVTLTGRDQAHETPEQSDLLMPTAELNPKEAADRVVSWYSNASYRLRGI
jgi:adenylylsulfate kinase-like enzyme